MYPSILWDRIPSKHLTAPLMSKWRASRQEEGVHRLKRTCSFDNFVKIVHKVAWPSPLPHGKTPGQFFWWTNSPPPGEKESSKPRPPRPIKRAKTPPPGHFPQLFTIKTWKMRQKSRGTVKFYHIQMIKR